MTKLNEDKYQQAILYFIQKCNNRYLGETKLNKLLYYLDFISYRDRSHSVTNDEYIHKDFGPVPKNIDDMLMDLRSRGAISIEIVPYKNGFTTNFEASEEIDANAFDDYERELLDKICKQFFLWPTDKIVNQTHAESPWLYSKPYDSVDYKYSTDIDFFLS